MLALRSLWPYARYARARRTSAVKGPPGRVESLDVHRLLSDRRFVSRCLDIAYPAPSQHRQCQAAGRDLGRDPETIRRWIAGATRPSFNDFWPVMLRVIHARAGAETYTSLLQMMRSL